MSKTAPAEHDILELIRNRWSPPAFSDRPVSSEDLQSCFEAARWLTSCFNEQPWRFIVGAKDGDPETHAKLLDCLVPFNQVWAGTAPVLMLSIGARKFAHNGAENRYALYDTGQAMAYFTIEAMSRGIYVHQMGGYDVEKARTVFGIGEDYIPGSAIAFGYEGDPAILTDEKYRERHRNPTRTRKPIVSFVLTGTSDTFGTPSPLIK